jgi:hypothetical protein
MISPESYYQENLKDKTAAQITTKIRSLRREIARLKRVLEHPDYVCKRKPSELTQLSCTQQYLERAKQALIDAGGVYAPTKTEEKIAAFNERLANISKVTFVIGGYLTGCETKVVAVAENGLHLWTEKYHGYMKSPEVERPYDVQYFINSLQKLNLGEWRKWYDPERYGIAVLDGTHWQLCFSFNDGQPDVKFRGSNAYPYNFAKLQELFDDLWLEGFEEQ